MKKIILSLVAAVAVLASCDPLSNDKDLELVNYTAQDAGNCVNFVVYKDEAHTQVAGAAEGNYVTYTTSPATTVTILQKGADGAEKILAYGPTGSFTLSPKRGSSTDQEVTVRIVNSDNTAVEAQKTVSVWVKSDLDPELKLLLGEAGSKKWMWDYNNSEQAECWGNAGNSGNKFTARNVDGKWWGVTTPEGLLDQLQHSNTGIATGEESSTAYMELDEDGNITSYAGDGTQLRKSVYTLSNYAPEGTIVANLHTEKPAVLFPFSINEGGKTVTDFDVMYLDANHMTLVYTKGNGAGSWGEITYWKFKNASASTDVLEGSNGRTWGWATDGYEIWGNAGNSGSGSSFAWNNVDGKWWGVVDAADLEGQAQHAGGAINGDESMDAYMIIKDGKITSYNKDNGVIRSGDYTLNIYADGRNAGWELGKLTTSAPAVLFPWSINEGGKAVTEFDVMYMDGDNMTLVYTKGNGAGSWGEITYWRFQGK